MSTEARIEEIAAENASIKNFIAERDASEFNYYHYYLLLFVVAVAPSSEELQFCSTNQLTK